MFVFQLCTVWLTSPMLSMCGMLVCWRRSKTSSILIGCSTSFTDSAANPVSSYMMMFGCCLRPVSVCLWSVVCARFTLMHIDVCLCVYAIQQNMSVPAADAHGEVSFVYLSWQWSSFRIAFHVYAAKIQLKPTSHPMQNIIKTLIYLFVCLLLC